MHGKEYRKSFYNDRKFGDYVLHLNEIIGTTHTDSKLGQNPQKRKACLSELDVTLAVLARNDFKRRKIAEES